MKNFMSFLFCGKGGIRTPGASQHGGFQDRCNRPLYHLSKAPREEGFIFLKRCKGTTFFLNMQNFKILFIKKIIEKENLPIPYFI